ncbi:hypothetical protein [Zobellella endophytica]|uniref:hypothetical protein n=1 Tax=Zobellella endophytica TaxID=2116700 RepID=UPI0011B1DF40|nr:hypothetical protein [Zobellella endophytica]
MRLILHPGHAKCGSTTIQNFLRDNRDFLFKNKFITLDSNLRTQDEPNFIEKSESPRGFFKRILNGNSLLNLEEKLSNIKNRFSDHTLIISAENLTNQIAEGAPGSSIHKTISEIFTDVTVIYYIKPQDTFLFSGWQQWGYKQGLSLQQYIQRSLNQGGPNYLRAINFFEKVYGKNNLNISPLTSNALINNDLIDDFCSKAKLPILDKKVNLSPQNVSLNPIICDILSRHPELFKDQHDEEIKNKLESLHSKPIFLHNKLDGLLPRKNRKVILDRFLADNKYIHETYFPHLDFENTFYGHIEKVKPLGGEIERIKEENRVLVDLFISLIK